MKERPNIVWILVDSVRSYVTDADDRGKLPMMERFGEHSVEFLNVVTSAPSTIMSISAMMTSRPSYMIARNYDDFLFDNRYFICLNDILKERGYASMAFFRHPHPREKLSNLLDAVPRGLWEPHLKHSNIWTNSDLRVVLNNALNSGIPRPAFLFVHFTCRLDPNTSEVVTSALQDLLEAGFGYDNTIYVLCSDHGYPDPSRGFTPEGLKRQGLSHDLILTDDNIKIPLYFKYPGSVPRKISATVSSLDIMPTIMDLAGISLEEENTEAFQGHSLKPLMEGRTSERPGSLFVRSDGRLMYQVGQVTAIRSDRYKYLRHHDKPEGENEELYDLVNDPLEGENIVDSRDSAIPTILAQFRAEFERQEREAFHLQANYILSRLLEQTQNQKEPRRVLMVVEPLTARYGELALQVLRKAWPEAEIDALLPKEDRLLGSHLAHRYDYTIDSVTETGAFVAESPTAEYDMLLLFTINPANPSAKALLGLSKEIRAGKALVLDCNMNASVRRRFWYYRLRAGITRLKHVVEEPKILLGLLRDVYQVSLNCLRRARVLPPQ